MELPASSSMANVNRILHTLEKIEPLEKTSMGPLLEQLADRVRRRGLVFLISDAFDEGDTILKGVKHLRFQGHDVTLFHALHPDEGEFPFTGNVKFDRLEAPEKIKKLPDLISPAYQPVVQ